MRLDLWAVLDLFSIFVQIAFFYVVLFALMLYYRERRRRHAERSAETDDSLEVKLRQLGDASSRAADLSKQINVELVSMVESAAQARTDAETAQTLADLSEGERAAVASLVRREMGSELKERSRSDFWKSAGMSLLWFVLGVIATVIVAFNVVPRATDAGAEGAPEASVGQDATMHAPQLNPSLTVSSPSLVAQAARL